MKLSEDIARIYRELEHRPEAIAAFDRILAPRCDGSGPARELHEGSRAGACDALDYLRRVVTVSLEHTEKAERAFRAIGVELAAPLLQIAQARAIAQARYANRLLSARDRFLAARRDYIVECCARFESLHNIATDISCDAAQVARIYQARHTPASVEEMEARAPLAK